MAPGWALYFPTEPWCQWAFCCAMFLTPSLGPEKKSKSIWNQWGTFCSFRRALDQVWHRKCRSESTNLSCISFYFLFPVFALISEGNMLYSICSQAVLGCEPPEPGTVSLDFQISKAQFFFCSLGSLPPDVLSLSHYVIQLRNVSGII